VIRPQRQAALAQGGVLQVLSSLTAAGFGPTANALPMVASLRRLGVPSICVGLRDDQPVPAGWEAEVVQLRRLGPRALHYAPGLSPWLHGRSTLPAVVHVHGLWGMLHWQAMCWARRTGRPVVLKVAGMLGPVSLRRHALRKRLFRRVLLDRTLARVSCLQAVSAKEAEGVRRSGLGNPIAVISNGVLPPEEAALCSARQEARALNLPAGIEQYVLFLGRLHPRKGTAALVQAWRELAHAFPACGLVLAGPDQDGHRAQLECLLARDGAADRAWLPGLVTGPLKAALLAGCEALVLPSQSEGFSVAVIEAMAYARPVVISEACNFPEVAQAGAGLICSTDPSALAKTLAGLLAAPEEQRRRMGVAGRRLVAERYSWDKLAHTLRDVYLWLLGDGPRPDCVRMD